MFTNHHKSSSVGTSILRISLGILLLAHAYLKMVVFTIPGTVGFFESVGFPGFFAYLTIIGELAAGAALTLGLATRLAALGTLPVFLGALYVHSGNGWVFSNEGGGWEFPALLVIVSLTLISQGSGAYALDNMLKGKGILPRFITA